MDRGARDKLISDNLPLVGYHVSEILRRVPSHVQREDLAAAGSLALVQAAQAYDPEQGVPFHRYATFRVRGAMLDELRSMDWASRGSRQRTKQLDEMTQTLTAASGRAPTREELANALGVDVTQVEAAQLDASRRVVSIDGATNSEDGQRTIDLVDPDMSPEDHLLTDERTIYLHAAVRALPDRLRYVVEQAFFHERQVSDIATELGVTQSRVSQLRSEALALIRDGMNAHLEHSHDNDSQEPKTGVVARRRASYFAQVGEHAQTLTQTGIPSIGVDAVKTNSAKTANPKDSVLKNENIGKTSAAKNNPEKNNTAKKTSASKTENTGSARPISDANQAQNVPAKNSPTHGAQASLSLSKNTEDSTYFESPEEDERIISRWDDDLCESSAVSTDANTVSPHAGGGKEASERTWAANFARGRGILAVNTVKTAPREPKPHVDWDDTLPAAGAEEKSKTDLDQSDIDATNPTKDSVAQKESPTHFGTMNAALFAQRQRTQATDGKWVQ